MGSYYVTLIGKYDETVLLRTNDFEEAVHRCDDERYYIEIDKTNASCEIRKYEDDIESDECTNFDYKVVY